MHVNTGGCSGCFIMPFSGQWDLVISNFLLFKGIWTCKTENSYLKQPLIVLLLRMSITVVWLVPIFNVMSYMQWREIYCGAGGWVRARASQCRNYKLMVAFWLKVHSVPPTRMPHRPVARQHVMSLVKPLTLQSPRPSCLSVPQGFLETRSKGVTGWVKTPMSNSFDMLKLQMSHLTSTCYHSNSKLI